MDKNKYIKSEADFYSEAFKDNETRKQRGFGWDFEPSLGIIELIKRNDIEISKVLDAGCGDGRHIEHFSKLGSNVTGVDFSSEAIDLCKKRFPNNKNLFVKDLTKADSLKDLGEFDLVINWSVMNHIKPEHLKDYLDNIMGSIKEGGYAIFAEFHESSIEKEDSWVLKSLNEDGHYTRMYTIEELRNVLHPLEVVDFLEGFADKSKRGILFNFVLIKK